jgi:diadenosine tetraphosphate (Ap4A) HIT family hydrolase
MTSAIIIHISTSVLLIGLPWTGFGPAPCTPAPALYTDWKAKTLWASEPDSGLKVRLDSLRGDIRYDPFDAVIAGDSTARLGERVLWEDDSVIVIVAKHSTLHDVLVLPKREMMFPVDASEALLARMSRAAAAVSDAFLEVAGKRCDPSLRSVIEISPPGRIGVKHLHVHVRPPATLTFPTDDALYRDLRVVLLKRLQGTDATRRGG